MRRSVALGLMQGEIFVILALVFSLAFVAALSRVRIAAAERPEDGPPERPSLPPLISMDEASGFVFPTGSATLTADFQHALREEIAPKIDQLSKEYDCDLVDVYGFTDGQPHRARARRRANFDQALLKGSATNNFDIPTVSNTELGLLRAAAVATFLRELNAAGRAFSKVSAIRPYSGGQLVLPSGTLASFPDDREEDSRRRRIEVRLSRKKELHRPEPASALNASIVRTGAGLTVNACRSPTPKSRCAQADQMELRVGDRIQVINSNRAGWYEFSNASAEHFWVNAAHVQPDPGPEFTAQRWKKCTPKSGEVKAYLRPSLSGESSVLPSYRAACDVVQPKVMRIYLPGVEDVRFYASEEDLEVD